MARPKKPKYEYVEKLNLYRKRVKNSGGKYVAIYGQTPDELMERILDFSRLQAQGAGKPCAARDCEKLPQIITGKNRHS